MASIVEGHILIWSTRCPSFFFYLFVLIETLTTLRQDAVLFFPCRWFRQERSPSVMTTFFQGAFVSFLRRLPLWTHHGPEPVICFSSAPSKLLLVLRAFSPKKNRRWHIRDGIVFGKCKSTSSVSQICWIYFAYPLEKERTDWGRGSRGPFKNILEGNQSNLLLATFESGPIRFCFYCPLNHLATVRGFQLVWRVIVDNWKLKNKIIEKNLQCSSLSFVLSEFTI